MVEQLGSGIPRILAYYPKSAYLFSANFIRLVLPFAEGFEVLTAQATGQDEVIINKGLNDNGQAAAQVTAQATEQVTAQASKLLMFCSEPRSREEMQTYLNLKHREYFRSDILKPLLVQGLLELTIPDKPRSPKQQYVISKKGKENHL